MTAPSEDAVGVARERAILFASEWNVDALIRAVRAECAAKVRVMQEPHIEDECSQCDSGFSCTARGVEAGLALALKAIAEAP